MRFDGKQVRKVTLEKKTTEKDDYGNPVETWNADRTLYAEKWDQGGKETTDGQTVAYSDVRFKIRYVSGLNAGDYRIVHDGQPYDIEVIKEIGRREGQMLITKAQDNE